MLKKISFAVVSMSLLASPLIVSASTPIACPAIALACPAGQHDQAGPDCSHKCVNSSAHSICPQILRSLSRGSRGDDVTNLQAYLGVSQTGYFGTLTAAAVAKFQVSEGISAIGVVGPLTRAAFARRCGNMNPKVTFSATPITGPAPLTVRFFTPMNSASDNDSVDFGDGTSADMGAQAVGCGTYGVASCATLPRGWYANHTYTSAGGYAAKLRSSRGPAAGVCNGLANPDCDVIGTVTITVTNGSTAGAPSISGVDGPTTLQINQQGTWSVHVNDSSGYLSYSVKWGDEAAVPLASGTAASASIASSGTFTHTYAQSGTYSPTFTVTNGNGQSASAGATVVVGATGSSPVMKLQASEVTSTRVMPRVMDFSASYPVSSMTNPNDTATYTIDYGDGTSGTFAYQNVGCPVDGGSSCTATWWAPKHTYAVPGEYTATLYKNGTQINSKSFLAFVGDLQSSTSTGPSGSSGPTGAIPLTVAFVFTGGTSIDFGDGSVPQTLCTNCSSQWSTTQHTIQHTYTTGGYHQMIISYNGIGMEGAGVSAISGTVTSISPSSGSIGTSVTIYGSGFTSKGAVDFLSLCSGSNPKCGNFTLKKFAIASDDSSITFTIPATYTVNTMSCTSGGGGCTDNPPQTYAVPVTTYSIGFDDTGFAAELPLKFTVTN